jgi:hypothetical protein
VTLAYGFFLLGKVTDNDFLIGLSSEKTEMKRNVQLLKEPSWLDLPIVYRDGKRAVVSIEKGPPGEYIFLKAFAAWKRQEREDKP